ncbi:hypothetical protein CcCBS67573_g06009 [Chytriomyces confervae]|uniref:CFEM domain-containing protein n=1 Tax=Chytriomyces confervae TaxID=246404 RepID=A0A507F8E6_9FUNG|nr:hypothetical protein CcCBS67573_g06009 [Chytriomyces confervae]
MHNLITKIATAFILTLHLFSTPTHAQLARAAAAFAAAKKNAEAAASSTMTQPTISNASLSAAIAILKEAPQCAVPCIANSTAASSTVFTIDTVVSLCSQITSPTALITCGTKVCNATEIGAIAKLFTEKASEIRDICLQLAPPTTASATASSSVVSSAAAATGSNGSSSVTSAKSSANEQVLVAATRAAAITLLVVFFIF